MSAGAQSVTPVGAGSGPGTQFATDAFPGFDAEKDVLEIERKEPRWFQFLTGPNREDATSQFEYCRSLEAEENWSKAIRQYDALVRSWPTSEEASAAQKRLAELKLEKDDDAEGAFEEYKYLVDFYSSRCDYLATIGKMYEVAGLMREQGKRIIFFRFKNTADVRRAYEACVFRAPGATWAPAAMLTIGELRAEDQQYQLAVTVYENLRNLYYGTKESKEAVSREADMRMVLLRDHGYNRARCVDTVRFLELAERLVEPERIDAIKAYAQEARQLLAEEAYLSAKFYDSRMRPRGNAISAYEMFLREHPESDHAEDVRARLEELKGSEGK